MRKKIRSTRERFSAFNFESHLRLAHISRICLYRDIGESDMPDTVKLYRDPVPGRGSIELRRTAAGVYSWVVTIWTDAIVTDAHLIGMVDSVERVDVELKKRYSEPEPVETNRYYPVKKSQHIIEGNGMSPFSPLNFFIFIRSQMLKGGAWLALVFSLKC